MTALTPIQKVEAVVAAKEKRLFSNPTPTATAEYIEAVHHFTQAASTALAESDAPRLVNRGAKWGDELPTQLDEWTDIDGVQFIIGQYLGIFPTKSDQFNDPFLGQKGTLWSDNPIGNVLTATLIGMVASGVLEYRDEPNQQFRWRVPDCLTCKDGGVIRHEPGVGVIYCDDQNCKHALALVNSQHGSDMAEGGA